MKTTRREFLKKTGIGLAGLSLAGCQLQINKSANATQAPTLNPTQTPTATASATPTQTPIPTATFSPDQIPDLVSQDQADFLAAHEVKIGDTSRKVIMMTYDDNAKYIDVRTILDAYNTHGMKASFFFIGEKMLLSAKAVRAIVEEGHLLGCHGYGHNDFMKLTDSQIHNRIEKCFQAVDEVVPGYRLRFIRFPYGSGVGSERILKVVAQWGLQHIYWSTGSNGTIKDTLGTVMRNAENGAIFLSHMYRKYDVEQAEEIVASLVKAGYSLETIETGRDPSDIYTGS